MSADETNPNETAPNGNGRAPDEQPTLVIPPAAADVATDAAPAEPAAAPYIPPAVEGRLPARASTIVWGILLLGFCAWTGVIALGGSIPNPITWLTTALIVGGIALVLVGIVAAVRKR